MLDIRQIRREPELVKAALARRGVQEEVVDRLVDLMPAAGSGSPAATT